MGDFVRMMDANGWIEGTVALPNALAHIAQAVSNTPRVYMTYSGGASNVITLAHELGHAYHSWVMRDLQAQKTYGMSLAETASTFGETCVMHCCANPPLCKLDPTWSGPKCGRSRALCSTFLHVSPSNKVCMRDAAHAHFDLTSSNR